MTARITNTALLMMMAFFALLPLRAEAQSYTEFRDPLRGVTFYSMQVSTDSLTSIQMEGSGFSSSDRMTLGFSAFFFDESETVEEYVLWLRHDGPRRWVSGDIERPLTLDLDGDATTHAPFHLLRPSGTSDSDLFVEKMEFALDPESFQSLFEAEVVALELRTLLGSVEKTLSATELGAIRSFHERVGSRHSELKPALAATTPADD